MSVYSFRGGVRVGKRPPPDSPILSLPPQKSLVLSLGAGGVARAPIAAAGERVLSGQVLADRAGGGAPLHSSVCGRVRGISRAAGGKSGAIILENDFSSGAAPRVPFSKSLLDASPRELIAAIRAAGVPNYGEGGAPLADLLESCLGRVNTVILNAVRPVPEMDAGVRLLCENPSAVLGGLKILLKLLRVREATLAIESDCKEALLPLERLSYDRALLRTVLVRTKYPGAADRPLISAALGKALPRGRSAADEGILALDPETLAAVYLALVDGTPAMSRVVTLAGESLPPTGVLLPFGTPLLAAFDALLRERGDAPPPQDLSRRTVLLGPPLQRREAPLRGLFVSSETSGVFLREEPLPALAPRAHFRGDCVHCGRCTLACPAALLPSRLYRAVREGRLDDAARAHISDCSVSLLAGCGCCTHVCPAGLPLAQTIYAARSSCGSGDPPAAPPPAPGDGASRGEPPRDPPPPDEVRDPSPPDEA